MERLYLAYGISYVALLYPLSTQMVNPVFLGAEKVVSDLSRDVAPLQSLVESCITVSRELSG